MTPQPFGRRHPCGIGGIRWFLFYSPLDYLSDYILDDAVDDVVEVFGPDISIAAFHYHVCSEHIEDMCHKKGLAAKRLIEPFVLYLDGVFWMMILCRDENSIEETVLIFL